MNFWRQNVTSLAIVAAATVTTPVYASNTQSGTTVTNNVTVSYEVDGIAQSDKVASNTFKVDRKVDMVLVETGSAATTTVVPGQSAAVSALTLTNLSNDTLDFSLVVTQSAGGTAVHDAALSDNFDLSAVQIYIDQDLDGTVSAGDTDITGAAYLDEVAPDANVRILVVGDIPLQNASSQNLVTDDIALFELKAQALSGGAAGTQGAPLIETTAADDPNTVDTVFADGTAGGNIAGDGYVFVSDDFTVSAAALTITKHSDVLSDPINDVTDPKAIPGAQIRYCIRVDNAASSPTATGISISDVIPVEVMQSGAIEVLGPVDAPSDPCAAAVYGTGSIAGNTVTANLPDLAGGKSAAVAFNAFVK